MKTRRFTVLLTLITGIAIAISSCEKLLPKAPENNETLDGPIDGLTPEQLSQFAAGDEAFGEVFHTGNGLGPIFVSTSCVSCHATDGKGHPFTSLTRFGQGDTMGNQYMLLGGPQLQPRAIPGHTAENIPSGAPSAVFLPPANAGLGLLAALTDAQLLANADPNDVNGDGISGRPNYVTPPSWFVPQSYHIPSNGKYIGRFGHKAAAIDLQIQTVNAFNQDIGVTSEFLMYDPVNYQSSNQSPDNVPDPEIPASTINNVVFYLRTIKQPTPRNTDHPDVIAGKQIFLDVKCDKCHTPSWTTGISDIAALSNITFYPYTDLLLHNMGTGLDDGYTEGTAMTYEWRTTPLWGLGLSKNSQGGQYYLMHDGRAQTIEDAINLHGGEGQDSKNRFSGLSYSDKQKLIKFLESL